MYVNLKQKLRKMGIQAKESSFSYLLREEKSSNLNKDFKLETKQIKHLLQEDNCLEKWNDLLLYYNSVELSTVTFKALASLI